MSEPKPHILIVEPYYGGSHQAFIEGLADHLPAFTFTSLTLPARNWKMRMQLAAPWAALRIREQMASGVRFDGLLASTFVDLAVLRSLLARDGILLPMAVYFHENQFAYPSRVADPDRHHFAAVNFNSALAADQLAFNSRYNQETFFHGVRSYLGKVRELSLEDVVSGIRAKASVIFPGIDYAIIDGGIRENRDRTPVIVWNHRWEHDKAPGQFIDAVAALAGEGLAFSLIVLGRHGDEAASSALARHAVGSRLLHCGYVQDRETYARMLLAGDIVVSTARHEFFGMAVLEAVRAGCRPLVPDRLSYRELFPIEYRYPDGELTNRLRTLISSPEPLSARTSWTLTAPGSWLELADCYRVWLGKLVNHGDSHCS